MANILVTGPSGFFGPYLIGRLLEEGHRVTAFVHQREVNAGGVTHFKGSITSQSDVEKAVKGKDAVCHLATAKGNPETFAAVNLGGLWNVLEAARTSVTPPQVVLLSGDNVMPIFDYPAEKPMDETHAKLFVDDQYGLSKILEETMVEKYVAKYQLPFTVLRSSWIMDSDRSLRLCHPRRGGLKSYLPANLKEKVDKGEEFYMVPIGEDGRPLLRHVVDPRDLASAFVWAIGNEKTFGELFNISGAKPFRYNDVAKYMNKKKPLPVHEFKAKEAHSFEIDTSKAQKAGFVSKYTIFETIDWALESSKEKG